MFLANVVDVSNYELYQKRREKLVSIIKKENPSLKKGKVLLFGNFDNENTNFRQESSFLYFSGIKQPAHAISIDLDGSSTLHVPNSGWFSKDWLLNVIEPTEKNKKKYNVKKINYFGERIRDFYLAPYFKKDHVSTFLKTLIAHVSEGGKLLVVDPDDEDSYVDQRRFFDRIRKFVPDIKDKQVQDISLNISQMRRKKDVSEIAKLSQAIDISILGHEAVAKTMKDGAYEYEVKAALEYVFNSNNAYPGYPSIVNSGKKATFVHCEDNSSQIYDGQLLLVDAGAKVDGYCADITRTYPISGKFTKRQRELYEIVLAAQKYIANIAKPGYCLSDKKNPKNSLRHLLIEFLKKKGGYDKYLPHGVGHHLGMDVHDVCSPLLPLKKGDVITIEPGIYIPDEKIGIRIEDNYWVTENGVVCLTEMLPKEPDAIEQFVKDCKENKSVFDENWDDVD